MPKFKAKTEFFVALQCPSCKEVESQYPLDLFIKAHGNVYNEQGFVSQYCECAEGKGGLANTDKKIVGFTKVIDMPATSEAQIKRKLNKKTR